MENKHIVTAEAVRAGHPDKLCDQIADTILDAHLEQDSTARVAVEVFATDGKILIAGEVTSKAKVDYKKIVLDALRQLRYKPADLTSAPDGEVDLEVRVHEQSEDIAAAVDGDKEQGAGDQGIMVGYATNETPEMLPLPLVLAQRLCRELDRLQHKVSWLGADGKAQVSVVYAGDKPIYVKTVVVSVQHEMGTCSSCMTDAILNEAVLRVIPNNLLHSKTRVLINPSGQFVLGGPAADTGLTGRKLAVDQYGPVAHIGGGAYCVDGATEFLTPHGWKRMDRYEDGDMVAQWDSDELSFVRPEQYIKTPTRNLYSISSPQALDMVLSENHDMVLITGKGNVIKKRVKELMVNGSVANGNFGTIPTSFSYKGNGCSLPLSDDEIRLQVAFCADGTLREKNKTPRMRVKRSRKKERIELLLAATGTAYRKTEDHEYSIYTFEPPILTKQLSEHFWVANPHQLKVIMDEVLLWDGDPQKRVYRTTCKADADFIQFAMMASTAMNASIVVDDRVGELYGEKYIRKSVLYEVHLKSSSGVAFRHGDNGKLRLKATQYHTDDSFMYCFCVPSGMLVLRRNDKVFVTGNSGKDPSKVDRSGAYMARYIAKNLVAAGLCARCEVQIAYAIGRAEPVSVSVDAFCTSAYPNSFLAQLVQRVFDMRPAAIIQQLNLRRPCYSVLAAYGHYGRLELDLPWEHTDQKDTLLREADRLFREV